MGSLTWLHVFGVSADGISMASAGQFELGFMRYPVLSNEGMRLLLGDESLSLLINAVLLSILGEVAVAVTHGLEHVLMDDLAPPQVFLLLLHLLLATVFITHVGRRLVDLILHPRSRIRDDVGRFGLHTTVFILLGLLLLSFFLLNMRKGRIGSELWRYYRVLLPLAGLNSCSCMGDRRCMLL